MTGAYPTAVGGEEYLSSDRMRFCEPPPDRWEEARRRAGLPDWPHCAPVPVLLRPVVNDLYERRVLIVTLPDLAAYDIGLTPQRAAQVLRRTGWLRPLRAQGVWLASTGPFSAAPGFEELMGRLAVAPDTPACIGGRSVPWHRGWLPKPTQPAIGLWPEAGLPRCLDHYVVNRWKPQAPLDPIGDIPAWSADTLVVFMAAKPSQFSWTYIGDWLPEGCDWLTTEGMLTELEGRSRAVWHKAAYMAHRGERDDIADTVLAHAPAGRGPYRLGVRQSWHTRPAEWHPRFEVIDNIFPHRWFPKAEYLRANLAAPARPL